MKQIAFVEQYVAKVVDVEKKAPAPGEVCVKMLYTAVSAGTERANVIGDPNVAGGRGIELPWPRVSGYSGSGIVESVGEGVEEFKPGDRVATYWGKHQEFNTLPKAQVIKIENENVSMQDAAFTFITTFALAAIRKTRLEIGESCMVVGLGLLGLFAVQYAKIGGAYPVIAVDFSEERRNLALKLGADYAFDPSDEKMPEKIKALTDGGANSIIEVTGRPEALNTSLLCAARFARVALLGCTRVPTTVNFYNDVHFPGVTLVGAHTMARPDMESHAGWWTHADDCKTSLKMLGAGRLDVHSIIHEVHSPYDAPEVYDRLSFDKNFSIGVQFDWSQL